MIYLVLALAIISVSLLIALIHYRSQIRKNCHQLLSGVSMRSVTGIRKTRSSWRETRIISKKQLPIYPTI